MADATLSCPHCGNTIHLTESLAAPLLAAERRRLQVELTRARADQEQRIAEARTEITAEEQRKAREAASQHFEAQTRELAEARQLVQDRDRRLTEALAAQAEALRRQRALDDKLREADVVIEKRIAEGLAAARQQARHDVERDLKLRVTEREETIASLQKKLEEMQRKLEAGSQQLQGEVLEIELEAQLRHRFPLDRIDPVAKGERGGDALQRVVGPHGQDCGAILWESKRTLRWNDAWLDKLKQDQRDARAEVAVIVSQALPKGVEHFDLVDGVWVVEPRVAMAIATSLRHSLVDLAGARLATSGQHGKMELVYRYLTGPHFRQRVQAIVEAFTTMQDDLQRERRLFTKHWARREAQIDRVLQSTLGMYGDLQGIAGGSELFELDGLELPALGDEDCD
ncbi:MAG: DUF2130 domain-containing protein [Burkholderiaceae bacterium]